MPKNIKSIETTYRGVKFRSRLEARWAVLFDAAGVKWDYEPEGFKLPNGQWYLPDFLLHNIEVNGFMQDVWVEIKAKERMTEDDATKIIEFSGIKCDEWGGAKIVNPIVLFTQIPEDGERGVNDYFTALSEVSKCFLPENCENKIKPFCCRHINGTWQKAFPVINKHGEFILMNCYKDNRWDYAATKRIFDKARQARFEHGESPKIVNLALKGINEANKEEKLQERINVTRYRVENLKRLLACTEELNHAYFRWHSEELYKNCSIFENISMDWQFQKSAVHRLVRFQPILTKIYSVFNELEDLDNIADGLREFCQQIRTIYEDERDSLEVLEQRMKDYEYESRKISG